MDTHVKQSLTTKYTFVLNVYKICHGVTARQCYLQSFMSNSAAAASTLKLRCEFAVLSSGTAATTETDQMLCADICMYTLC